ncbi:MAG TPA: 3-dehydroquinate synthase, partial [Candidatus Atribacteria bacterium]|nr:3-dehydroquinate synthase [Candidatus Atribacteria bacterium]
YKEPALVITSHSIWERWGDYIENSLKDFKRKIFFLPEGESAKSMEYVYKLWEEMFSLDFTRKNPVLLIGGGTIGDTGGFAASTFMRGVPIIQLPTTLLSQLDSSIGGKRGVNYKHLKNMIGTFYDATYTVLDPVFLLSLPEREIKNGLSEAIKSAIIGSSDLFDFINTHITEIFSYNLSILEVVVKKTVKIKLDVVSKDPYELTGYRKVLNLGHTLGHALESIEDFSISHGEGVSIGMAFAAFLGEKEGITPVKIRDKIVKLIKKSGLPISLPDVDIKMLIKKMYYDKKREDEKIFWVIPEDIGRVGFYKFDPNKVEYFIREFSKGIS